MAVKQAFQLLPMKTYKAVGPAVPIRKSRLDQRDLLPRAWLFFVFLFMARYVFPENFRTFEQLLVRYQNDTSLQPLGYDFLPAAKELTLDNFRAQSCSKLILRYVIDGLFDRSHQVIRKLYGFKKLTKVFACVECIFWLNFSPQNRT